MRNRYFRGSTSRKGHTFPLTKIVLPKNSGTTDGFGIVVSIGVAVVLEAAHGLAGLDRTVHR